MCQIALEHEARMSDDFTAGQWLRTLVCPIRFVKLTDRCQRDPLANQTAGFLNQAMNVPCAQAAGRSPEMILRSHDCLGRRCLFIKLESGAPFQAFFGLRGQFKNLVKPLSRNKLATLDIERKRPPFRRAFRVSEGEGTGDEALVLRGLHPPNPRYVRNLARTYRGGLDSESRPIFAAAEMPVTKDHMPFPASIGER